MVLSLFTESTVNNIVVGGLKGLVPWLYDLAGCGGDGSHLLDSHFDFRWLITCHKLYWLVGIRFVLSSTQEKDNISSPFAQFVFLVLFFLERIGIGHKEPAYLSSWNAVCVRGDRILVYGRMVFDYDSGNCAFLCH